MRTTAAVLCALLGAGCAMTAPPDATEAPVREPAPSDRSYGPLVPASVRVERALVALEHGGETEQRRARAALLAQDAEHLEPLRIRLTSLNPEAPLRREILAVMAERGEDLGYLGLQEQVDVEVHVIARREAGGYATLRALARLEALGEPAREPLERLAEAGGERGRVAAIILRRLFRTDRDSQVRRP